MEYSPKQGEPFDPVRYWTDRMEKLTSNQMSNVSRNRARLYGEVSEMVQGRPPALTPGIIDTLMDGGYPTSEVIKSWVFPDKVDKPEEIQPRKAQEKTSLKTVEVGDSGGPTRVPQDDLSKQIKEAAETFERSGGWKRYKGSD